jgi:Protein of unknown function (DUF1592)/Protein of unknown function (DUF1588)/Protein of unknown function (DUF1585)/Protein of unknown function (DUF1595)/Protein of unknown function (DUF1587)/Planctomycete cytochrome C
MAPKTKTNRKISGSPRPASGRVARGEGLSRSTSALEFPGLSVKALGSILSLFFAINLFGAPLYAGPPEVQRFLQSYCNDCHGAEEQNGERRFDTLVLPAENEDTLIDLKDILDQLNLGEMPPDDAQQPSQKEIQDFIQQATQQLTEGRESLVGTHSGTVLRRLNRREYLHTIGDLFGLNMAAFDPTTQFPRDQTEENMEKIGDVLQTSGYLLDQYLDAADLVVEKVFAMQQSTPEKQWHFQGNFRNNGKSEKKRNEYDNLHLLVLECMDSEKHTGGYAFIDGFKEGVPADGVYEILVLVKAMNRQHPYDPEIFGTDSREPFRLGIVPGDGRLGPLDLPQPLQPILAEVALGDGEPTWHTMKVWLDAGHTPRFVFPNGAEEGRKIWSKVAEYYKELWPKFMDEGDRKKGKIGIVGARQLTMAVAKFPHIRIDEVKVRGPLVDQQPKAPQQILLHEAAVNPKKVREVLRTFASRAYRRPVTQEELERLVGVAQNRVKQGHSPQEAFKDSLKAVLCSPAFLYHSQATIQSGDSNNRLQLDPYALATRLSYFLWSSMPDDELFRLAHTKQLTRPEVLLTQTRRMLDSPRSDAFVSDFLDSWLNLRSLGGMPPDRGEFETYYSKGLERAFKKETQLFMRDLIDRDASIANFLDCDYGFINQPLATHYGVGDLGDPSRAHEFRKVSFTDSRRGGLLGMGSVLTITANGIETSPVTRGVFLLENILGTPPPPPPDDVPAIDPDVRGAKTVRELLSKHRESPTCYGCHQKIDPLGFALENFDPVGGWRDRIEKSKIDSSGELPSGEKFTDVKGLKKILVRRQELFARMLVDRLLTYACGRRIGPLDEPFVESIVAKAAEKDHGLRTLIEAVVTSEPFLTR